MSRSDDVPAPRVDNPTLATMKGKGSMNSTGDFKGQVTLVTGASSGTGLTTARAFAEAAAALVLADITEEALHTAIEGLTSSGHQAMRVSCEVSKGSQVAAMIERAVATLGRLDMAFSNAAVQVPPSDAADERDENFDRVNALNLRGVWTCMKHELRQTRARGQQRYRQLLLAGWLCRVARPSSLPGIQASGDRPHKERCV
jgi:NAD(P)-dependent dehydrogenase (short-subunit alcohol dehydrogenase family)